MKILHVIFSFSTGGAETMLVDIINEQIKFKDVNLLIVNNLVDENLIKLLSKNVKVHFLQRKPGSLNPFSFLKFNFLVRKIRPNVLHFHNPSGINLLFFNTKGTKCLTVHDVGVSTKIFSRYDKIFAISKAVQQDIFKRGSFSSTLVYNGIKIEDVEKSLKIQKNGLFKIVQISRLEHMKKGQHILLEALRIIVKEKNIATISVDFIGDGKSSYYLKGLAKEMDIVEYVNFLGPKDRIYIYKNIKNYNLLIQPSIYEGFGLTVIEGMAAKIPVLVSDIDGPLEIISNGTYGFYFKSEDARDCAYKILTMMNMIHLEEVDLKILNAYNYVKENFDISKTAQNYIENYIR
jgi:glycosyltransferase involved in cell wall biosynthesis